MAIASDLAKQLNPTPSGGTPYKANANPFGADPNSPFNSPGQTTISGTTPSSSQTQFGFDYTGSNPTTGGNSVVPGAANQPDQLTPNNDFFNQFKTNLNQATTNTVQTGIDATNQLTQQIAQQQAQKAAQDALNFQRNSDSAGSYTGDAIGTILGQLPTGADPNNAGARAVAIAKQVANNRVPYVWGGNSLTQGVDCSGLVQQVYAKLGIRLPRTSTEQAKFGKIVPSLAQALPGDLILEYSPYEPAGLQQYGHVAIYIGNGLVVEAPGTGKNVRIGPIYNMTRIVRPW